MRALRQQFLEDNQGHKIAVLLPIAQYNKMLENMEELEDIKAYDKAKSDKQEFIPAEQAFREIEKKRRKR